MPFNLRFDLEIAVDEGSQFNSTPKDRISILGAVFLTGKSVEDAGTTLKAHGNLPKWRDASAADAEFVLGLFQNVKGWAKFLLLGKDNSSSRSYGEKAKGELAADREREQAVAESVGKVAPDYPTNPEHLLRTAGVASILSFREVVAHHAIVSQLYRLSGKVSVRLRLYFDRDSTPEAIQEVFRNCMHTSAADFRGFQHKSIKMAVNCEVADVLFEPETSRASLMVVDYLCGIIAATTFPKYSHANITKQEALGFRSVLEDYGKKNKTLSIISASLSEVEEYVDKAGKESLKDFRELGL